MTPELYSAVPNDSRYVPLSQQDYCCVPTSIQMIMLRNGMPLVPAEEIGYHLGLTVPPESAKLFYRPRIASEPPTTSGYGTQINAPEYEPNQAFRKLGIALSFSIKFISEIASVDDLVELLKTVENNDADALLCFNHAVISGKYKPNSGHAVVFDRIINGKIQIVDASPYTPKWRQVEAAILFDAMQQHGDVNSGGIWFLHRLK